MNELTIEEFDALSPDTYVLYDIRSTEEINHGAIRGAIASSAGRTGGKSAGRKGEKAHHLLQPWPCEPRCGRESLRAGLRRSQLKGWLPCLAHGRDQKQEADEVCDSVEKEPRARNFTRTFFSKFAKAINQYELVKEGDRIAVCISGGKDSILMAKLFQELKKHNKFPFEVKFLVMDPGYSPENRQVIEENARKLKNSDSDFSSPAFSMRYTPSRNPRAISVPACAAAISIPSRSSWAAIRSRLATIMTM